MSIRCLLLVWVALLMNTSEADDAMDKKAEDAWATEITLVPVDSLTEEQWAEFVPVTRAQLSNLLQRYSESESTIRQSTYSARLVDDKLTDGKIAIQLPEVRGAYSNALGHTNFTELKLSASGVDLPLALHSKLGWLPLVPSDADTIEGTWSATGVLRGRSTVFDLKLPSADIASMKITTDGETQIRSPNAVVLSQDESENGTIWELLPANPTRLTIECQRTNVDQNEPVFVSVNGQMNLLPGEAEAAWSVTVPKNLAGTKIRFRLDRNVSLEQVQLDDLDVSWQVVESDASAFLDVVLPPSISGLLAIRGAFEMLPEGEFRFPFLVPDIYVTPSTIERPLRQRVATIKASVDSRIVVKQLDLDGLFKKDVSFAGNDNVVMEFEQFSKIASATVRVEPALPLIQDAVVVRVESLAANVDVFAYVRATVRSGTVNRLSWKVSENWRVTDVRGLEPDASPLLFRVTDSSSGMTQLDVTLRDPLTSNSASQALLVRMQSVGDLPSSQQLPVGLFNDDYQRSVDQLAMPESLAKNMINSWAKNAAVELNAQQAVSWLPADVVSDLQIFSRADLRPVDSRTVVTSEIDATIEYSVDAEESGIVETAKVLLRTRGQLPTRIPLSLSTGKVPEVASANAAVSLARMPSDEEYQWVIELDGDNAESKQVEFVLTARSSSQPKTEGMTVLLANCQQSGRIVPPDKDSGISLAMQTETQSSIVSDVVEYPNEPFTLELIRSVEAVAPMRVWGRNFVQISGAVDRPEIELLCRSLVMSGGRTHLEFDSTALDGEIWVDGKKVHPERSAGLWRIPLPPKQSPISIDVMLLGKSPSAELIKPLIEFKDSEAELSHYFLPAAGQRLSLANNSRVLTAPSARVGEQIAAAGNARAILDFAARWMLRTTSQPACVVFPAPAKIESLQLAIAKEKPLLARTLIWMTATILFCLWLPRFPAWRCGAAILLLLGLKLFLTDISPVLEGSFWGASIFGVFLVLRKSGLRSISHRLMLRNGSSKLVVGCLMFVVLPATAMAQLDMPVPRILSPTAESPVVYVHQSMLGSLQHLTLDSSTAVAVLESQLELSIVSADLVSAAIRTTIAAVPDVPQHFVLPLNDVTLAECRLDGRKVFPKHLQSGTTIVPILSDALLPTSPLTNQTQGAVAGPRTLGDWSLHVVEYEVRVATELIDGEMRLPLPLSLSPRTTVSLSDPQKLVSNPRLKTPSQDVAGDGGKEYSFPVLWNTKQLELLADLVEQPEFSPSIRNATVSCVVDVLPGSLATTTEYRLTEPNADQNTLRLGVIAESIVSVRSIAGAPLPWTVVDSGIEVTFLNEETDELVAVVTQQRDTDLSMKKVVEFGDLRLIDELPAENASVAFRTTDQFVVDEVLGDGANLPTVASSITNSESARVSERKVQVPSDVSTLSVTISQRIPNQLIEDVSQQAIIHDDYIDWSCSFQSEISGQPAFRQVIILAEGVRVDQVTATLVGTDRLQSWSRTRDSVVVFLREATRGTLEIQINGTIPRSLGVPTPLSFAGFPSNVQVLQSSLGLSSNSSRGEFVSSFGGAQPNENFDSGQPLSSRQLRLSVIDDSRPMVIKEQLPQFASVSIACLIFDDAGQTRATTFMRLEPQDATAPLKFRVRDNEIESRRPIVFRNRETIDTVVESGVLTIPPTIDSTSDVPLVVVLPNGIPVARNDSLLIQTPEFASPTRVTSCVCFDLTKTTENRLLATSIPSWVSDSIAVFDLPSQKNCMVQVSEFDPSSRRVEVRLAKQDQSPADSSVAPGVIYVDCEHFVQTDECGLTGVSGFLVFASQSRSDFEIQVPEEALVTRVNVNNFLVPFAAGENALSVALESRVSHVVVDWIVESQTGIGPIKQQIALPFVNSTPGLVRAALKAPEDRSRWWRTTSTVEPGKKFRDKRVSSLLTGLQVLETEAGTELSPEITLRSSIAPELASQIWSESADAMDSLDRIFERNEGLGNVLVSVTENSLVVKDFRLPSPLILGSLVLGVGLILIPWWRTGASESEAVASEGSTVVHDLEMIAGDDAMTVVDVKPSE